MIFFGIASMFYLFSISLTSSQIIISFLAIITTIILIFGLQRMQYSSVRESNVEKVLDKCIVWWKNKFGETLSKLEGKWLPATYYNPIDVNDKREYYGFVLRRMSGEKAGNMVVIIYDKKTGEIYANDDPSIEELENPFANFNPFVIPAVKGKLPQAVPTKLVAKLPVETEEEEEIKKLEGEK